MSVCVEREKEGAREQGQTVIQTTHHNFLKHFHITSLISSSDNPERYTRQEFIIPFDTSLN
jgi:hypothetical protein